MAIKVEKQIKFRRFSYMNAAQQKLKKMHSFFRFSLLTGHCLWLFYAFYACCAWWFHFPLNLKLLIFNVCAGSDTAPSHKSSSLKSERDRVISLGLVFITK